MCEASSAVVTDHHTGLLLEHTLLLEVLPLGPGGKMDEAVGAR